MSTQHQRQHNSNTPTQQTQLHNNTTTPREPTSPNKQTNKLHNNTTPWESILPKKNDNKMITNKMVMIQITQHNKEKR